MLLLKPYTFPEFTFTPPDSSKMLYASATQTPSHKINDDGEECLKELFANSEILHFQEWHTLPRFHQMLGGI